jgi:hypothetical protein
LGDPLFTVYNVSSSGVPRLSPAILQNDWNYEFIQDMSPPPKYGYRGFSRCVCVGKTWSETPKHSSLAPLGPLSNGSPRILPDTFDVVVSQTNAGQAQYGQVALPLIPGVDGRLGSLFGTGQSRCGCPNFNEQAISLDSSVGATDGVGVRCVPSVTSTEGRVLAKFDPSLHDAGANTQVMNRSEEPVESSTGLLVRQILLPQSITDQATTTTYHRKIWTCQRPYRLNVLNGACEYAAEIHACSIGDATAGVPPSVVSPFITGRSKEEQFLNAQNKKLGACLNEFDTVISTFKFDCIENAKNDYANFDELWSSADPRADGGQLNAIQFANGGGQLLTGFFELNGRRCDEFNEMVGDVQPGRLKMVDGAWTFEPKGSVLARPDVSLPGYQQMIQKFNEQGLRVPSTIEEKRRCPILIRAAVLYSCPSNPAPPGLARTFELKDASGNILQRRCTIASSVQLQFKMEQVFEIEGTRPMKPMDTIQEKIQMAGISVAQLNTGKFGSTCPPGTSPMGDACVY